jgi:glutamate carboxypeptidase
MNRPPTVDSLAALQVEIQRAYPDYLADLERLADIDSGSYDQSGVNRVADWVAKRLTDLGATVQRHTDAVMGDTVVGVIEGDRDGPTVLMIGHMDTVFETGTVAKHPIEIQADRAVGPGVGDMKAGLIAGLYALRALRTITPDPERWLPVGRLVFVANPDEEVGSPVSKPIISRFASEADASLVLEGARPNGDLVSARKGMMHFEVTLTGKAAHAGVAPEKGRSAVLEAAHKSIALHELSGRWDGVTVNVGSVHGGTRPNIVAEHAVLGVDMRAADLQSQEAATSAIEQIVATSTVVGVTSDLEINAHHKPMEKSPGSQRLIDQAKSIAAYLGFEIEDTATGGGSDANTTAGLGIPTLDGLGPVCGNAHTLDDYIELRSVVPRVTLLAGLVAAIGAED